MTQTTTCSRIKVWFGDAWVNPDLIAYARTKTNKGEIDITLYMADGRSLEAKFSWPDQGKAILVALGLE